MLPLLLVTCPSLSSKSNAAAPDLEVDSEKEVAYQLVDSTLLDSPALYVSENNDSDDDTESLRSLEQQNIDQHDTYAVPPSLDKLDLVDSVRNWQKFVEIESIGALEDSLPDWYRSEIHSGPKRSMNSLSLEDASNTRLEKRPRIAKDNSNALNPSSFYAHHPSHNLNTLFNQDNTQLQKQSPSTPNERLGALAAPATLPPAPIQSVDLAHPRSPLQREGVFHPLLTTWTPLSQSTSSNSNSDGDAFHSAVEDESSPPAIPSNSNRASVSDESIPCSPSTRHTSRHRTSPLENDSDTHWEYYGENEDEDELNSLVTPSSCSYHSDLLYIIEPETTESIACDRIRALLRRERIRRIEDGLPPSLAQEDEADFIEGYKEPDAFRKQVIRWLLTVMPTQYVDHMSLYHHLCSSTETRFHAIQLFSRYCHRIGEYGSALVPTDTVPGKSLLTSGRQLELWDVALGCLTVSVKFHHDFLGPLSTIPQEAFTSMARYELDEEGLTSAQADVFDILDNNVYDTTPQAYFVEFWDAIPHFQELHRKGVDWRKVRGRAWELIQKSMFEPDFLRFRISLLSMGAVLEAVVKVILEQYFNKCDRRSKDDVEAMEWLTDILEEVDQEGSEPDGWCNVEREIRESTQKIAWALVDLMDIPMVDIHFCRSRLKNFL